jgi:conjugation system TraG family ATPase
MAKWADWGERLPVLEVASDCIVSKMGDLTIGLEVEKPEIFTLGVAGYEGLHGAFVKALKVLPAGAIFHMQDTYQKDRYKGQVTEGASFLAAASERFFDGRPYLRHECRIYLTLRPRGRRAVSSASSGLLRSVLVPEDTLDERMIAAFEDSVRQFMRILTDTGLVKFRRIKTEELVSTARSAGIIERYCYLLEDAGAPVLRDIEFGPPMRVGEKVCVLYTLADAAGLPGACSVCKPFERFSSEAASVPVGFAAGLGLLLPFGHLVNTYIVLQDQAAVTRRLEAKRLRLQSMSKLSRENTVSAAAVDAYLNEAVSEGRLSVKWHLNVLAWGLDEHEMAEIRTAISSAMAGMDAVAHVETVGSPQLWWAGIPGNAGELPENECVEGFLEQACCFLQYETNYRSFPGGFGFRLGDRLTGVPVQVDIDVEPKRLGWIGNGNLFMLSGSGGGKSYWMAHLCRSYYALGVHTVLVDVGRSYETLCKLLGGVYLTYEEERPIRFNPFWLAPGEVLDIEKKESIKSLLMALWKRADEEQYRSEYVTISAALEGYYGMLARSPDVFSCFDSFYSFMEGEYAQSLRERGVKAKEFDLENFLYVLRPYASGGEFDFLLNARENLDLLSARFIVFELSGIVGHPILFPVVTMVIVEVFMAKVRKLRGVRKMIVIEEAWKAIANSGMADEIRSWVKTLRKHLGKLALVSQEVDDIIDSPIIKQAVINSSDCKILLDQSKFANRFSEIQKLLGLTDKQKAEILSLNKGHDPGRVYKDCWIGLGASWSRVYRLETSPEEYWAYTSDEGDKVKIEAAAKEAGSLEGGVRLSAEKDLRGA